MHTKHPNVVIAIFVLSNTKITNERTIRLLYAILICIQFSRFWMRPSTLIHANVWSSFRWWLCARTRAKQNEFSWKWWCEATREKESRRNAIAIHCVIFGLYFFLFFSFHSCFLCIGILLLLDCYEYCLSFAYTEKHHLERKCVLMHVLIGTTEKYIYFRWKFLFFFSFCFSLVFVLCSSLLESPPKKFFSYLYCNYWALHTNRKIQHFPYFFPHTNGSQ